MPGIATRQLARAGDGMRNFQQVIYGAPADNAYFAAALTGAPLTSLVAGSQLTLIATGMPLARSVTALLVTGAAVQTRVVTLRFHGKNQFGEYVTDDITLTAPASTTIALTTDQVFAEVNSIEVITATLLNAADNLKVGLAVVATGLTVDDITYGLSQKVLASTDILGGTLLTAGAATTSFPGTDVTFIPDQHGVQLPTATAPDAGADRLVVLNCRTTW